MIVLSFLDPRRPGFPVETIAVKNQPREAELYGLLSDGLVQAKARGESFITIDVTLSDGQRLQLPNVFFVALTDERDNRIIVPPPPGYSS